MTPGPQPAATTRTEPTVKSVKVASDGLSAKIVLDTMTRGHVHEFDLVKLRSRDGETLVHRHAYYTVNEVPKAKSTGADR